MSSIDSNSQAHLNSILDKIGVRNTEAKKSASKDTLGQEDFLKLMTTQLQKIKTLLLQWKMLNLLDKWLNFQLLPV